MILRCLPITVRKMVQASVVGGTLSNGVQYRLMFENDEKQLTAESMSGASGAETNLDLKLREVLRFTNKEIHEIRCI